MKRPIQVVSAIVFLCLFFIGTGQARSKYGSKKKGEQTILNVHQGNPIDHDKLQKQTSIYDGANRGVLSVFDPTAYVTNSIDMAFSGIQNIINREKRKYQASYEFNIAPKHHHKLQNDSMYFYDRPSAVGPFDVSNMKFSGFTVCRKFGKGKDEASKQLAMRAYFELDTTNLCEIAYDGIFRLKLKEFEIHYAKAKMPGRKKKLNLDIEVQFLASYITKDGHFTTEAVLGTFTKTIGGVVLQDTSSFQKFENTPMDGWSFVVPRSYCHTSHGDMWNQGSYSIKVTVKETSRPRYVNKLATEGTGQWIKPTQTTVNNIIDPLVVPKPTKGKK